MTEQEKKALHNLENCCDYYVINESNIDDLKIVLTRLYKQDTEINKLNNVIDKMAKCINAADVNREENVDICKDKGNCIDDCLECKDCIKEYFMTEERRGEYE